MHRCDAPFDPETLALLDNHTVGDKRSDMARKDFKEWVSRVGFEYYSPKEFRHGYATHMLNQCITLADYQAVSQNMMHSSLKTTDEIYAILTGDEVRDRLANLGGESKGGSDPNEELISHLENFIETLKN
jgi:integrase